MAKAIKSVASSFGLRSGLRQSSRPLRGCSFGTAEAVPLSKDGSHCRAKAHISKSRYGAPDLCGALSDVGPPPKALKVGNDFAQDDMVWVVWVRTGNGPSADRAPSIPPIAKCAMAENPRHDAPGYKGWSGDAVSTLFFYVAVDCAPVAFGRIICRRGRGP